MKGIYDVYIVKVGEDDYRVRPSVISAKTRAEGSEKNKVYIRNATDGTAILVLPKEVVGAGKTVQPLENDKKNFFIDIDAGATTNTPFRYTVYIAKDGKVFPAKGESDPIIIIDD